jgi:eukaryotic-like serine/threonine-protein kinase
MSTSAAGRYVLFDVLAQGGMASVHFGRLLGSRGFARTVAIKRLHPHLASDPVAAQSFVDEAQLAARVRHPNVVSIVDVISEGGETYLVMDYVHGESLSHLVARAAEARSPIPLDVIGAIVCGTLDGLNAAHDAKSDAGTALHIVHRDVSPQNILIGADGVSRVLDFGIAKFAGRTHLTGEGRIRGKLAYMAPEQLEGGAVDRRTDVFAAGIVLWELLTMRSLFGAPNEGQTVTGVLGKPIDPPSAFRSDVSPAVDLVVQRALQRTAAKRFPSARQMALELEASLGLASASRVAKWVEGLSGDVLSARAQRVEAIEARSVERFRRDIESVRLVIAAHDTNRPKGPTKGESDLAYAETAEAPGLVPDFNAVIAEKATPSPSADPRSKGESTRGRLALAAFGAAALGVIGFVALRGLPSGVSPTDAPPKALAGPSAMPTEPGPSAAIAPVVATPNLATAPLPSATGMAISSAQQRRTRSHSPSRPKPAPLPSSAPVPAPTDNPNAEY